MNLKEKIDKELKNLENSYFNSRHFDFTNSSSMSDVDFVNNAYIYGRFNCFYTENGKIKIRWNNGGEKEKDSRYYRKSEKWFHIAEFQLTSKFINHPFNLTSDMINRGHADDCLHNTVLPVIGNCSLPFFKNNWEKDSELDSDEIMMSKKDYSSVEEAIDLIRNTIKTLCDFIFDNTENFIRYNGDFVLRKYQIELSLDLINLLKKHRIPLLNACPRTGKSSMSIAIAFHQKCDTIIILTPYVSAKDSFEKVITTHKYIVIGGIRESLYGWKFITKDNVDDWYKNGANPHKCVFFFSFASGRYENKEEETRFNRVASAIKSKSKKSFLIVDEAHNTSDTDVSKEVIDKISANHIMYMSGTPFNDLYNGRFVSENTVNFDIFDAYKESNRTDREPELKMPDMYMYEPKNISDITKDLMNKVERGEISKIDFGNVTITDWQQCFATLERTEYTLKALFTTGDYIMVEDGEGHWFKRYFIPKHILMYVPNDFNGKNGKSYSPIANVIEVLKKLSHNENYVVEGYTISSADDLKTEKDANDFQKSHKNGTIIVAKEKFTTGVTLERLDSVLILRPISSAELFNQIIYRPMSYFKDEETNVVKDKIKIVTFDPNIVLNLCGHLMNVRQKVHPKDSDTTLAVALNNILHLDIKDIDFELTDTMKFVEAIRNATSASIVKTEYYNGMGSEYDILDFKNSLSEEIKESIFNSKGNGKKHKDVTIHSGSGDGLPNNDNSSSNSSNGPSNNVSSNKKDSKILDKIRGMISELPDVIFCNDIIDFQDLIDKKDEIGYSDELLDMWNVFLMYINKHKNDLNNMISNINGYKKKISEYGDIDFLEWYLDNFN